LSMVLSICHTMFGSGLPVCELVALAVDLGYEGLELLGEPSAYQRDDPRLIREAGLQITALSAASRVETGRDLASAEPGPRRRAIDHLMRCIAFARECGCPVVGIAPSAVGRFTPHGTPADDRARAADSLAQLAPSLEGTGIRLGIEILNRYTSSCVRTVEEARMLMGLCAGEVPIGLAPDLFHLVTEEADLLAALRLAVPDLATLQVSDSNRQGIGHGYLSIESIFDMLAAEGYRGPLALEAYLSRQPFCDPDDEGLAAARTYAAEFACFALTRRTP
jgi:D-psicose/D-tagatose/L-ribulose 3-epimerase